MSQEPIAHVENNWVAGDFTQPDVRSIEQAQALRLSDELIDELLAADVCAVNLTTWGLNFHEPYLRAFFGFIGMTDVTIVSAGGQTPEAIANTTDEARTGLRRLAVEHSAAAAARAA